MEVPAVNAPLLDQLPLTLTVCALTKVNGADALIVRFPFMVAGPARVHDFVPALVMIRLL